MYAPRIGVSYLALASGVFCLSLSSLFVRWAQAPGVVTAFFRMGIATTVMAPFFVRQAHQVKYSKGIWLAPILAGVFAALDQGIWSTSVGLTRVANATLLNNTAPVWVALVAWFFFHEKLKPVFWLGLGLAMVGASVVLGGDMLAQPTHPFPALSGGGYRGRWGDLLAIFSGIFYAAYFFAIQSGRRNMNAFTFMGLANPISCLTLLAICLIFHIPLTGYPPISYLIFLAAAIISQVCGHLSLSYALGQLPASIVAPTMIAQPIVTALLAIPFLGESLQLWQWLGGVSVLAGIVLINNGRIKTEGVKDAASIQV